MYMGELRCFSNISPQKALFSTHSRNEDATNEGDEYVPVPVDGTSFKPTG